MLAKDEELKLLKDAQGGDKEAMTRLVAQYEPLIGKATSQAHLRVVREDALSVAHLAFLEAVASFEADREVMFAAYARKKVYGDLHTFFRQECRRWQREFSPTESCDEELSFWDTIPDERDGTAECLAEEAIKKAIASLTTGERQLLDLLLAKTGQKDIARILGVSQQTVSYRRGLLRKKFKSLLRG
ncbi:MAG: sigma-70 family RNA polymerase sigma factor [Selenomonadaceae bacterium]|nr:sigma-70 family RNA polymerase sigma factor [Selenomonadaceae bacterium]